MQETGLDPDSAAKALQVAGNDLSVAIVMTRAGVELGPAVATLRKFSGRVPQAIKHLMSDKL
jgi:N-acetylmuramic acid 6-phosphate (MurNAc-6-P) etherase